MAATPSDSERNSTLNLYSPNLRRPRGAIGATASTPTLTHAGSGVSAGVGTTASLRQPETHSQARTHDRYARAYRDAGLCPRCSYQAAYGHQLGFGAVHPPCESCATVVAGLPNPKVNRWRALPLSTSSRTAGAASVLTGAGARLQVRVPAHVHTEGAA